MTVAYCYILASIFCISLMLAHGLQQNRYQNNDFLISHFMRLASCTRSDFSSSTTETLSAPAEVLRYDFNNLNLDGWVISEDHQTVAIENGELIIGLPLPDPGDILVGLSGVVSKDYDVTVSVKIAELLFQPVIANGAHIGLRAHPMDQNEKRPLLQYDLSYNFLLGRHTDGRRGIGAAIWHVHKIVRLPDGRIDGVHFRNKLLEFSPFHFRMHKWYRLKVIARGNRFQAFVDEQKMLDFLDNTYPEGRIYLSSGHGNRVHFDNFEVRWGDALGVQSQRKLTTTWGEIKRGFR